MKTNSTVVVCARNEESYVRLCILSILDQTLQPGKIILLADRCTDRTVAVAGKVLPDERSLIVEKHSSRWNNSISENLEIARDKAVGEALVVVDADMIVPCNLLEILLPQLENFASVSATASTDPSQGFLNAAVSVWEKFQFVRLGDQPRGGVRAISLHALNQVGGFRDVIAWDSELDTRLRRFGYRVKTERGVSAIHRRKMTIGRSVAYQKLAGRSRRELGMGFFRTFLHSLVRLRPFVILGYVAAY